MMSLFSKTGRESEGAEEWREKEKEEEEER